MPKPVDQLGLREVVVGHLKDAKLFTDEDVKAYADSHGGSIVDLAGIGEASEAEVFEAISYKLDAPAPEKPAKKEKVDPDLEELQGLFGNLFSPKCLELALDKADRLSELSDRAQLAALLLNSDTFVEEGAEDQE